MNTRGTCSCRKHLIVIIVVILAFTLLSNLNGQASELAFSTYFGLSNCSFLKPKCPPALGPSTTIASGKCPCLSQALQIKLEYFTTQLQIVTQLELAG